jgi:recombination protein RecR
MDPIERLSRLFERFPGIGPRQAQRFVAYLLRSSPSMRRELIESVQELAGSVHQCQECQRYHAGNAKVCSICKNTERNRTYLAVVASDADLAALERSGTYRGLYFVLGGTISLASEKMTGLRIPQLLSSLPERIEKGLEEAILAFPANPEGDATSVRVREELEQGFPLLKITTLGRGLSTGSELEYADPETIKSALDSRR